MTRKSLTVYNYRAVPDVLPTSRRKSGFIDSLDTAIEGIWSPALQDFMQPIGHPQSKRFFIQQYQAAMLIQTEAAKKGLTSLSSTDPWTLMSALRRVAHRRGIAPTQLLMSTTKAAAE